MGPSIAPVYPHDVKHPSAGTGLDTEARAVVGAHAEMPTEMGTAASPYRWLLPAVTVRGALIADPFSAAEFPLLWQPDSAIR